MTSQRSIRGRRESSLSICYHFCFADLCPLSRWQSISVTQFQGINDEGMVDISPLRKGDNASLDGGGEIYSCGGSVGVEWSYTGLLETVSVRVSHATVVDA